MKNQLVFYVSKVKSADDKWHFVIKNNMERSYPIWTEWDEQRNEPDNLSRLFNEIKNVLRTYCRYPDIKMEFMNEPHLRGSNPFGKTIVKLEPSLDQHFKVEEIEIEFWRKLMLDICIKKL